MTLPSIRFNRNRRRLVVATAVCSLLAGTVRGGPLRAAAVTIDITPDQPKMLGGYGPRESTGVHDPIHHRVLVLNDGEHEWVLASSEFCVMSPELYETAAVRLATEQGVDRLGFWWTLTHTHSAPEIGPPGMAEVYLPDRYDHAVDETYTTEIVDALLAAIAEARAKVQPARIGWGWGESRANINRRARDVDGSVRLGMNPDGPVDRRIGLLRVESTSGDLIAHVANYAIHGTVLGGQSKVISGDAPGVVSAYVEAQTGAPMLFVNGAAGDVAPLYSVYPNPRAGHLSEFRFLLGDRILSAAAEIAVKHSEVHLDLEEIVVDLPGRSGLELTESLQVFGGRDSAGKESVRLPVRLLRFGEDVAIWSAPLELFSEVALEVRARSSAEHTFYFGYTNGWLGYLLTDEELPLGGYEPRVSPFGPGAAPKLAHQVSQYLEGDSN
ncbi:neutral/alkaline non-lysosomal ceramidase N-terminal domain-containing protein [Synoicihabitans lomoniglobus]|uniref:Neutral/alkaline non-lysosomal ceramidase N-terminal domain-containing protein n=1 Tax=Synoicihabitans lomoniglobus TaxID=2909285 RepID=A0AAE9ZZ88_9BACT|nr:neutral/alkaline non-lysosomal ceramidase N-terminal domain-containing protein [Opitutaceae bacterium LMO-M01]WED64063.1 neutral/alkaline non-lysosomal ceramidase N-terminal domain-containing protein [Opitutaceae bacterium LMO-M01]